MSQHKKLRVTLVKSSAGRLPRHRATVRCLGLTKRHQSVELVKTPQNEGMIRQVAYLLHVEEC